MARIKKGILGPISGLVGTVVGGTWRGIDYLRSKPVRSSTATPSQAQLDQQSKFRLVVHFVQTLSGLLEQTFKDYAVKKTGRNSATSYLLKNAVTGASPVFTLNYSQVLISRGDLPGAAGATATAGIDRSVTFSWSDNTGTGKAAETDKAVVVVYSPMLENSIYSVTSATRITGTTSIDTSAFSGQTVHTWMSFLSANGKEVANSVYTGTLVIA
jgi:hypothetical protein